MNDGEEIGYLDEPLKRTTTINSRYTVGCASCGFVEAFSIKNQALLEAERHFHDGDKTSVFDSMAQHGKPDCWHWTGKRWHVDLRPMRA